MSRRLYLGRLPPDTTSEEMNTFFDGCGRIVDCRAMTGFGFVEFENAQDAEEAIQNKNGKSIRGQSVVVEFAKESRPRREEERSSAPRSRRPAGICLVVSGISRDTSWQDLKDFGREAGSVSFADVDRDNPGDGVLEYLSRDDAERAVRDLDGKDLRGRPVHVTLDEPRDGADNYRRDRRDDRRDDRRGDGRDHDRYSRDNRDSGRSYRRERSKSPSRRPDLDDRRPARSPPPRRENDERRPAGYDDRRGGDHSHKEPDYYDRRRDERDDRRNGARDDRRGGEDRDHREDRSGRDGGWNR